MSERKDAAINIDGDPESEFAFQDFHTGETLEPGDIGGGKIEELGKPMEERKLLEAQPPSSPSSNSWLSLLSLEYYQGFFDVTTVQVVRRTVAGMVPLKYNLVDVIRPNPDLYGPFWLCMTLIFTTAISGNIVKVFEDQRAWEFHFHEVIVLGCAVYAYTWVVPAVLSSLLWWRGNNDRHSLLELLSIYGYSIGIFIPITMLWVIDSDVLRWTLLAVGAALSGAVLVLAMWKPFKAENKRLAFTVLVMVFLMHAGLAVGFKFYYFSSALSPEDPGPSNYVTTAAELNNSTIHVIPTENYSGHHI